MIRYYTLKCNGKILKNHDRDLVIGQCGDADFRLPSDNRWEDENFFAIRYSSDSDSWYAVRISDNVNIKINGMPFGIACLLNDGDVIEAEDSTIRFNIIENSSYKPTDGIVISSSRYKKQNIVALFVIAVMVLSIGAIAYIQNKEKNVEYWNLSESELTSVRKIHVEGVFIQRMENGDFINKDSLNCESSGTCFITNDGKLITARHCIQPWLELTPTDTTSKLVKLVTQFETERWMEQDSSVRLVTKISIEGDKKLVMWSSDFNYNDSRDLLINYGTRAEPKMWRSIRPSYHYRENELGDIAWMDNCGLKGKLRLAGEKQMSSLEENEQLNILGFAITDGSSSYSNPNPNRPQYHPGTLIRLSNVDKNGTPNSCLFHDDKASKGDSGGPVLIRRGHRYYVISVLSRKDEHRGNLSGWSVPVSEIKNQE